MGGRARYSLWLSYYFGPVRGRGGGRVYQPMLKFVVASLTHLVSPSPVPQYECLYIKHPVFLQHPEMLLFLVVCEAAERLVHEAGLALREVAAHDVAAGKLAVVAALADPDPAAIAGPWSQHKHVLAAVMRGGGLQLVTEPILSHYAGRAAQPEHVRVTEREVQLARRLNTQDKSH